MTWKSCLLVLVFVCQASMVVGEQCYQFSGYTDKCYPFGGPGDVFCQGKCDPTGSFCLSGNQTQQQHTNHSWDAFEPGLVGYSSQESVTVYCKKVADCKCVPAPLPAGGDPDCVVDLDTFSQEDDRTYEVLDINSNCDNSGGS